MCHLWAPLPRTGCGSEPPPAPAETEASTAELAGPAGEVDPPLLVDAGGLRLLDISDSGERRFAFGSDWQDLRKALAFRGEAETGINRECGAGPLEFARWSDGLTLHVQAGEFAGWSRDGRSAGVGSAGGISTAAGIGPGRERQDHRNVGRGELQLRLGPACPVARWAPS